MAFKNTLYSDQNLCDFFDLTGRKAPKEYAKRVCSRSYRKDFR